MRRFIVRENIRHYEHLLASEQDSGKRAVIEQLLVQAQDELSWLVGIWRWTCPPSLLDDEQGSAAEGLLDRLVSTQNADFASLQIWDGNARCLRLIAHFNFDCASVKRFAAICDGDGTVCEAVQASTEPIFVDDVEGDGRFAALQNWTRRIGIRSICSTPILDSRGGLVGVFSTYYATSREYSDLANATNQRFADQFSQLLSERH